MRRLVSLFKRHWRPLAAAAVLVVVARAVLPCPLQGNWVSGLTAAHGCEDHAFLRFADGYTLYYHADLDPDLWGVYEKRGRNTYSFKYSRNDEDEAILHVGWIFLHWKGYGLNYWMHRDFKFLQSRRIVRSAQSNARHARERIRLLSPGMKAPEVWTTLGLTDYRTPKRLPYRTQDVQTAGYLLSPGEVLHCDWDMTTKPPVLLKAALTGWPEGL